MVPWHELGRAKVGNDELVLSRRGDEHVIRLRGAEPPFAARAVAIVFALVVAVIIVIHLLGGGLHHGH